MTKIRAPRHLLLYCRRCAGMHPFHLLGINYYGQDCYFEITIHTLLATYSSVVEKTFEDLLMPLDLVLGW